MAHLAEATAAAEAPEMKTPLTVQLTIEIWREKGKRQRKKRGRIPLLVSLPHPTKRVRKTNPMRAAAAAGHLGWKAATRRSPRSWQGR